MTLGDLLLRMSEVCCCRGKKCLQTPCTRILTDYGLKKKVERSFSNHNKTRINIGHQHDRWVELKEALRVQTHAEV